MAWKGAGQEQLQYATYHLNQRPRKVLGFKTPFEVFFSKTVRYNKPPLDFTSLKSNPPHYLLDMHNAYFSERPAQLATLH